ncbi:DUF1129 domain-containing protein [Periweissella cryptocerci]|uniref:DUF1129 domain-containing protein n=1 Tax=Periweissella cryptocerci TaxID=2506420 RepID=A0A4P6YUF7_9LACO|nr:DUF1129 family protein [Periweissella cryptocerci]QBO36408.1 DUF1129 domain-containing protein [Periweissella cryptocerci]
MTEEENKQPRNANVVQEHHGDVSETTGKNISGFGNLGLTKRNEDFMFQLNKHLDASGMVGGDKRVALEEVVEELKAGQKAGKTAKQLYGTASEKAASINQPKRQGLSGNNKGFWPNAIDTALMFFAMFSLVFGISMMTAKGNTGATYGIVGLLLTAISGGLIFAYIQGILAPANPDNRKPIWFRIVITILAVLIWMAFYGVSFTVIPKALNPGLPGFVYIILAVIAFVGFILERRVTGISGGMFGGPSNNVKK